MKKALISLLSFLGVFTSTAFHIVGGEIEFITVESGVYRINLIQYKDEAQTENPGYDPSVLVYIYSNKDDSFVSSHLLPLSSVEDVFYTNPDCAIEELKTSKVLYSADFELDPEDYGDAEGYYIEWERCCRNTAIKNIVNPEGTGMNYVLEIPPLWKDGEPFINSSPTLLKPLSDYACVGQLYYTEFTGTDTDGDSLVYKMAVPLNSSSQTAVPDPQPKPHIQVAWADGFSLDEVVPGTPSLSISNIGLLTVNPEEAGLYVFSVVVEEWRNQEKIGQVQRDFQMLVIDGCEPPEPPEIGVKIPDNDDFNASVDTLKYTIDDDKCFEFVVTNLTAGRTISLRAEPVGFDADLSEVFQFSSSLVGTNQDTLIIDVCVPACPPVRDGPFVVDFIVSDDACPLPQMDTLRMMIEVEPPPNVFPEITSTFASSYSLNFGEELSLDIVATDGDLDSMDLVLEIEGVEDPTERGFTIEIVESVEGEVRAVLQWDTDCQHYYFGDRQSFHLKISVEDWDVCELESPEAAEIDFSVNLPENTAPQVSLSIADSISVDMGASLRFDVSAVDADGDTLRLKMVTPGFSDIRTVGVVFQDTSGVGAATSPFSWELQCEDLGIQSDTDFEFYFIADDQGFCSQSDLDTVRFVAHVIVPENNKPEFYAYADTTIKVNTTISLEISAFDLDESDSITIEFFNPARLPKSSNLQMESVTGVQEVTALFEWTPECSLIDFGETSAFYDIDFLVYDNSCPLQKQDTLTITFEIVETREQFASFVPPNVFTPNNDGKNDSFTLTNSSNSSRNLPLDNCDDIFQYITIHDRNGSEVFRSTSREFNWNGENAGVGVYYYLIKYSRTEYKGYLQLLR